MCKNFPGCRPASEDLQTKHLDRLTADDLIVEHERRLAELAAKLGAPKPVVSSVRGLAEMMETLLLESS